MLKEAADTPFSFLSGCVQDKTTVRVVSQFDEQADEGAEEADLMKYVIADKAWQAYEVEFRVIDVVTTDDASAYLFGVGWGGDVVVANAKATWEEHVDATNDGPSRRGQIRFLQSVGGVVYAGGMGRQLYRRMGKNSWVRADQGMVQTLGSLDVSGLNGLIALPDGNLAAVGFLGEIWEQQKGQWQQLGSPTNLILHAVAINEQGLAYCCGQAGVVLRRDPKGWVVVPQGEVDGDLWSVASFKGKWYFASDAGVHVLDEASGSLSPVDLGAYNEETFLKLHAHDGLLLAVGSKAVLLSKDARKWTDITP